MVVDAVTLFFLLDIFVTQVVQTPGALEIWQKGYDLNLKVAIFSKKINRKLIHPLYLLFVPYLPNYNYHISHIICSVQDNWSAL